MVIFFLLQIYSLPFAVSLSFCLLFLCFLTPMFQTTTYQFTPIMRKRRLLYAPISTFHETQISQFFKFIYPSFYLSIYYYYYY